VESCWYASDERVLRVVAMWRRRWVESRWYASDERVLRAAQTAVSYVEEAVGGVALVCL